jgi:hypothetical protein
MQAANPLSYKNAFCMYYIALLILQLTTILFLLLTLFHIIILSFNMHGQRSHRGTLHETLQSVVIELAPDVEQRRVIL